MKKLEFINELGAQLHSMPAEEVRPLLDYYMEIVADRMEDGMTEEEAFASLGPIPELAEKILAEQPQTEQEPEPIPTPAPLPEPVPQTKRRWSGSSIVLAIVLSPLWLRAHRHRNCRMGDAGLPGGQFRRDDPRRNCVRHSQPDSRV